MNDVVLEEASINEELVNGLTEFLASTIREHAYDDFRRNILLYNEKVNILREMSTDEFFLSIERSIDQVLERFDEKMYHPKVEKKRYQKLVAVREIMKIQ